MWKIIREYESAWDYYGEEKTFRLRLRAIDGGAKYGASVGFEFKIEKGGASTVIGCVLSQRQVIDLAISLLRRLRNEEGFSPNDIDEHMLVLPNGSIKPKYPFPSRERRDLTAKIRKVGIDGEVIERGEGTPLLLNVRLFAPVALSEIEKISEILGDEVGGEPIIAWEEHSLVLIYPKK